LHFVGNIVNTSATNRDNSGFTFNYAGFTTLHLLY
jgi:hypothetical protein